MSWERAEAGACLVVQAPYEVDDAAGQPAHQVACIMIHVRQRSLCSRASMHADYRAPVRYRQLWSGSPIENGLAMNFSAVRSGRLM